MSERELINVFNDYYVDWDWSVSSLQAYKTTYTQDNQTV